jgi:hypothetical protein
MDAMRYLHRPPSLIVPPPEIVIPPFVIVCPPFTLRVDAFSVEGIPPPPPGTYGAPLMVVRLILLVLIPPFKVASPATCSVWEAPIGPLNIAPGASTTRPPTAAVCPNTAKEFPSCVGVCISTFPEFTARPPVTTDIPPLTIKEPFVIVCPPFTLIVDALRVEGIPPPPPGGYGALFTLLTLMLAVLMLMVLRAGDLIVAVAFKIGTLALAPN